MWKTKDINPERWIGNNAWVTNEVNHNRAAVDSRRYTGNDGSIPRYPGVSHAVTQLKITKK